jgi:hypothetical protein
VTLPLAAIVYDDSAAADAALADAARQLQAQGRRLGGVVQSSRPRPDRARCDMWLADLFTGEEVRISQDLGDGSSGCRLDLDGLARAHVLIDQALTAGVEGLILNRFGKQEAEGRGLRQVMVKALTVGLPVATAVPRRNLESFIAFAGEDVCYLPADSVAVATWWNPSATAQPDR